MQAGRFLVVAVPTALILVGAWCITTETADPDKPQPEAKATSPDPDRPSNAPPSATRLPPPQTVQAAGVLLNERPVDPQVVEPESSPEDQLAYATSVFDGESVDRGWAADAQREVDSGLRATVPDHVELGPIECRSTLCKATLTVDGSGDRREIMGALLHNQFWKGAGLVQPQGKDSVVVVLVRVGHELPTL